MTAVFAALLVTSLVVLSIAAWHTRHRDAPGIPGRENGALTAWDPAELRAWTLELHHTEDTPPWPPALPPTDGGQGGGHGWLTAPLPVSLPPGAGGPSRPGSGGAVLQSPAAAAGPGDPVAHDLWQPRPPAPVMEPVPAADPVADLTGAADRVRALTLDEYEAALPCFPHHPDWYATLTPDSAS
jgi:hypothetical protein